MLVPVTVAETRAFSRRAEKLLSAKEREELVDFLANHPLAGNVIEGTGGVRKVRLAAAGIGKSGGVRTIYFYFDDGMPLYALLIYGKNDRADLTADEKRQVAAFAERAKSLARARRG